MVLEQDHSHSRGFKAPNIFTGRNFAVHSNPVNRAKIRTQQICKLVEQATALCVLLYFLTLLAFKELVANRLHYHWHLMIIPLALVALVTCVMLVSTIQHAKLLINDVFFSCLADVEPHWQLWVSRYPVHTVWAVHPGACAQKTQGDWLPHAPRCVPSLWEGSAITADAGRLP